MTVEENELPIRRSLEEVGDTGGADEISRLIPPGRLRLMRALRMPLGVTAPKCMFVAFVSEMTIG